MSTSLLKQFHQKVAKGALKADPEQEAAARKLQALANALKGYRRGRRFLVFAPPAPPRGLYLWGDVGRGKSMLMDLFFAAAPVARKRRVHFNAFMAETHARIHAEREKPEAGDPIPVTARNIAEKATLLCFDEFQVADVADAMILGRLFEHLFAEGVVIVATSNTEPGRLYEGGLNRQLFLPFIALIEDRMAVVGLNGATDYRLLHPHDAGTYFTPLGPKADAAMDKAWARVTGGKKGAPATLSVLGRALQVPASAAGAARFSFAELCEAPLAGADYLALARAFHTLFLDRIPALKPENRNEARRLTLLIDTLYDARRAFYASAAAPPEALYPEGDGADAFRRTASRLIEMQGRDYLRSVKP